MIRHTLSFRFADGTDQATRDSVLAELRTFPDRYPAMRGFVLGENISTRGSAPFHSKWVTSLIAAMSWMKTRLTVPATP